MNGFIRGCGIALVFAGGFFILINGILSPMLPVQEGEAVLRASDIYLVRLSAASITALLLLSGGLGLHLAQRHVSGTFGTIAFLVSFIGNSLLFAVEWSNTIVLRAIAQTSPETFTALNESTLMTVGFAASAGIFLLGWVLLSISAWLSKVLPRWASLTALAGLIAIPALGASPLGIVGQIVGDVIFGAGLIGMGYALTRTE